MQRVYRTFLAATLMALMPVALLPAAAQDEEQPRWFGGGYDDVTTLAYGIPDSDYVALHFSCATGKPVVNVYVQDEESSADEGATMQVRLSAGGQQVAFSGKAMPNEDSGGKDVKGALPPDAALRAILTATGELEIVVDGHIQRYAMEGAAEPAATMLAACDAPRPAGDLDVTVTNEAKRSLQSFAWSEAGVNSFDSDAFGYETLEPGASRTFTIPDGRAICTFDLAVTFAEEDEEDCCSDPTPAGTQNLCENSTFVVHD
ncbi:MAG: hypothetical protein J0I98_14035 [Mesorhizobium sp.]|nr:hypothetical protein [Mesorhizobium sp.]MBN9243906.1 hypothetical protein [Mesorhizobium sp.]